MSFQLHTALAAFDPSGSETPIVLVQASARLTYIDIETLDFRESVTVAPQIPTGMTVSFSGIASPVPLGDSAPLFALSVAGLGCASSRRLRRR